MQNNAFPDMVNAFAMPSVADLIALRNGGKAVLLTALSLALIQLIIGFLIELGIFSFYSSTILLLPMRVAIAVAWAYFIWNNYTSYMQGLRFTVWLDLACTAVFTFYVNIVYNKIDRQCFNSTILMCTQDPQYSVFTSWVILLTPLGLSVSPFKIFALIMSVLENIARPELGNIGIVLNAVIAMLCGLYWPLYLDGTSWTHIFSLDIKWLYIAYYTYKTVLYSLALIVGSASIGEPMLNDVLMTWPAFVVFVLPQQCRPLMYVPYIIYILQLMLHRYKKKAINPMQEAMSTMMNSMMNQMQNQQQNPVDMNAFMLMRPPMRRLHNVDNTTVCENCGSIGAPFKCSQCRKVQYCDRECQEEHWPTHQEFCETLLD
jgi:hypothetical protein